MKKDFLKKNLVFEVVGLLVILSIVPVFSSGFNVGTMKLTDEKTAEETCLTEGFKEHKNLEYQFREDSSCLMKTNNDNDETDYMRYYKSICTLPENSIVCGYVNNAENSAPIKNAYVDLLGRDSEGHYYHNDTYSDSSGFYSINVAAGDFKLDFEADRYYSNSSEDYNIGEYETLWVNTSLCPYPPENSVVCGYVTDASTGDPIEDAYVGLSLNWWDDQGHHDWNSTHTDSSGYYSMSVAAGVIDLHVSVNGYYSKYAEDYAIGEDEILWVNFSIYPRLPENSVVCGYITDETTGDPIGDNRVGLSWSDELGNRDSNGTYTDSSGYYSMSVATGHVRLYVYVEGKNPEQYVDIDEYEILWVNFSIFCIPPKNSTVRGYVTDEQTGDPIKYAGVGLWWEDNQGHYYWSHALLLESCLH
jgi:protocatechuate 3,4-dioxygenase beta subunit